ncbi:unnamed protein product [Polarella glacialis]|nr:unnamed protein product [Polarella glacialis]
MTNKEEYFASLSAAYFSMNDIYPFSRSDLKEFDKQGFALMQRLWHLGEEDLVQSPRTESCSCSEASDDDLGERPQDPKPGQTGQKKYGRDLEKQTGKTANSLCGQGRCTGALRNVLNYLGVCGA